MEANVPGEKPAASSHRSCPVTGPCNDGKRAARETIVHGSNRPERVGRADARRAKSVRQFRRVGNPFQCAAPLIQLFCGMLPSGIPASASQIRARRAVSALLGGEQRDRALRRCRVAKQDGNRQVRHHPWFRPTGCSSRQRSRPGDSCLHARAECSGSVPGEPSVIASVRV